MTNVRTFNPPPGWPKPPKGWTPPKGWKPDPNWPAMPDGWELWVSDADGTPKSAPAVEVVSDLAHEVPSPNELCALKDELARLRAQLAENSALAEAISLDDQKILQDI